jgi:hypothetical protein
MEYCTKLDLDATTGICRNCNTDHADSNKLQAVEMGLDGIDFAELKKECFRLVSNGTATVYIFPNIYKIGNTLTADLKKLSLSELADWFGKLGKILWIKEIRSRYNLSDSKPLGLHEAKLMADGMWRAKGWE